MGKYVLTDADVRKLRSLQRNDSTRKRNTRSRRRVPRLSRGASGTRIGQADGAISARSGTTVGSGTVSIYTLVGTTLTDTTNNETWYNMSESAVTSGAYVQGKVVSGVVFVDFEDCG